MQKSTGLIQFKTLTIQYGFKVFLLTLFGASMTLINKETMLGLYDLHNIMITGRNVKRSLFLITEDVGL